MEQLILHVGTSKTGTSSLQAALAANRAWLADKGINYPEHGSSNRHHHFAHSLREGGAEAREFIANMRAAPHRTGLISSEAMYLSVAGGRVYDTENDYWPRRLKYLDELERATAGVRRVVVLVFRRPDEFAESLYGTAVQRDDVRLNFSDFRRLIHPILEYQRQVDAFRERFEDVRVVKFEDIREDLVGRMAAVMALPDLPNRPAVRNVSPDARTILWLLDRNRKHGRATARSFLRSPVHRALFPARGTLWESAAARDEFCRNYGWDSSPAVDRLHINALSPRDRLRLDAWYALFLLGRPLGLWRSAA